VIFKLYANEYKMYSNEQAGERREPQAPEAKRLLFEPRIAAPGDTTDGDLVPWASDPDEPFAEESTASIFDYKYYYWRDILSAEEQDQPFPAVP
jgi:hypothetical protein